MKHFIFIVIVSFIFLGILTSSILAEENHNQSTLLSNQEAANQRLKDNVSNLYVKWNNNDVKEKSFQFLEKYKDLYKISNPREELKLQNQKQDNLGMTHITLQQEYQGVPVYAARLKFR